MTTFARLFRQSKFVQLGDFQGRAVIGRITHRVADDCYVDFGLKFPAVCKAPAVNNENYVIGSNVLLRLHTPELSERFLGSKRDLTLLEADATLLKLYASGPRRAPAQKSEDKTETPISEEESEKKTEEPGSTPAPSSS
uniref:S1 motif domain-containing protein n=1 Tax=Steinernema glaseri TaxID=37863 RepID=A0A1I7Z3J4_9BILA